MIPAGYMLKRVKAKEDWLKSDTVVDVYSVSNCFSEDFADYIDYWQHNGYWLFDSPDSMVSLAKQEHIDLSGTTLFYYEIYEYEFDGELGQWSNFAPFQPIVTPVQRPIKPHLQGFDVVSFWVKANPEHSPLCCNSLATDIPVNSHCLFNTFEEAKNALEQGFFENSEKGPYRIFAVYTLNGSYPL